MANSKCDCIKISFEELYSKHYDLIHENYKETGFFKEIALDLNLKLYLNFDDMGYLHTFKIVKDRHDIGYFALLLCGFLHYQEITKIQIDTIFVLPEFRSLSLFKSVLNYIEAFAHDHNIRHLLFATSVQRDLGLLLKRNKFQPMEVVYYKGL